VARRTTIAWSLLVVLATGCPRSPGATASAKPAAPFENRYPGDISLPAGVQYPCAVTALPADLVGIPDEERNYVNHVYAVVIGVVRAKQVLLGAFARPGKASQEYASYVTTTEDALTSLKHEAVPAGLETFHQDVIASVELHRVYFQKLATARAGGSGPIDGHQFPEGHEASAKLMAAWHAMEGRYTEWSPAVKDSIYHHLCAFDLY
jgi:hypothetical protein